MRLLIATLTAATAIILTLSVDANATTVRWPAESIELNVQFDTSAHTVSGVAKLFMPLKGPKTVGFLLNKEFSVTSITANGIECEPNSNAKYDKSEVSDNYGVYGKWDSTKALFWSTQIPKKALRNRDAMLVEVQFSGKLYAPPDNRKFSREEIAFEVDGTIGKEGIFLSGGALWYPRLPDAPCPYKVTARVPKGWNFVTNGSASAPTTVGNFTEVTYTAEFPTNGIDLSAGPFVIKSIQHEGVTVSTYFLPAEADLADGYLEACKKFLSMYSALIGPYPFPKFAVVDNFLPSGYGMPGWTLLGSEVIRLPFIKETSLGHEILHNWFGNGIEVDYREGNWCEGLTTYLADYKYKADGDSAAAVEYRNNTLREYADFVNAENDYPVKEFVGRTNQADRAIGYGKVMMIFHMLKTMYDQEDTTLFIKVIQQAYKENLGKPMSWFQWRQLFERRLGQKIDWFFAEWLDRKGRPSIKIENASVVHDQGSWMAQFDVITEPVDPKPYIFSLNIRGVSDEGQFDYSVFIQESPQRVSLAGPGYLEFLRADPACNLFRVLYPEEAPLTLAAFIGDKEGILVVPAKGVLAAGYKEAAEGLKTAGQTVITDAEFKPEMAKKSLWLFGSPDENSVTAKYTPDKSRMEFLPGKPARWKEEDPTPPGIGFRVEEFRNGPFTATMIFPNPQSAEKCIVYTASMPGANPVGGTRKIPHYGKYSYLMFEGETNVRKGAWAAAGKCPMIWEAPAVPEGDKR